MPKTRRVQVGSEEGFSLIELVMASLVLFIVLGSLSYVLINSLVDTAYASQRNTATNLANQTVEEVRALPFSTLEGGMVASDLSGDANVVVTTTGDCFQDQPLDVYSSLLGTGVVGSAALCTSKAWQDPSCLTAGPVQTLPTSSTLTSPQPVDPHQQCYKVGTNTYGVDVYITGTTAVTAGPPLFATVVVSWANPIRHGLPDHVVTTTELSNCATGSSSLCT